LSTTPVQVKPIRIIAQPALGTPHLPCRTEYTFSEPSAPIPALNSGVRVRATLIGEDQDMILEHDEEIADFLSIPSFGIPLITEDRGVTPQGQEQLFAKAG